MPPRSRRRRAASLSPPSAALRRGLGVALVALAAFTALIAPPRAAAQAYGLDAPQPIAAFLGGTLPSRTPNDPSSTSWQVVPAFPNVTFDETTVITASPASDDLYVGARNGVVYSIENRPDVSSKTLFLDLSDRTAVVWDGGFLGLTFHPEFGNLASPFGEFVYVWYASFCPIDSTGNQIDPAGCDPGYPQASTNGFFGTYLRLSRFRVPGASGPADRDSEQILINIRLYNGSHRGGGLLFGDDGYLYISIGEQFRYETAQDLQNTLEGGVMRLAVDVTDNGDGTWTCPPGSHAPLRRFQTVDEVTGLAYCIPDDNPFPDPSGTSFEEYFTLGNRAPHRLTKDRLTGRLWSGEIGQSTREEVNIIEAGRNYGWPFREGLTTGVRPQPATILGILTDPVIDFTRSEGNAVIGGYVYRGARFPELDGMYLVGDYGQHRIWAIGYDDATGVATKLYLTAFTPGSLTTFGEDNAGEVYMGSLGASRPLYTLQRIGPPPPDAPPTLSQVGAFGDLATLAPVPGLIPYDLNVPFWSDGARKYRWIALPNDGTHDSPAEQIGFSPDSNWIYPIGTVLVKHFELPVDDTDPSVTRRIETRFQVKGDDGRFYGLTYRWRPDGTDADLLSSGLVEPITIQTATGTRVQSWTYPSRDQCRFCHSDVAGGFLGPRTHQLNRDLAYPGSGQTDNQLRTWNHLGMFAPAIAEAAIPGLLASSPSADVTAPLEDRARAYLDSNCSYCHRPGTGNRAQFDARLTTPLTSQNLIYGGVADNLGLPGMSVITPRDRMLSAAYHRMASLGAVAMPPLAKAVVDQPGVDLVASWIDVLDPGFPQGGLDYEYYEGTWDVLPDFDALVPVETGSVGGFDISLARIGDNFGFRFSGVLQVDSDGAYTFYTTSDDGSQLFVDGALVVDNDGLHAPLEASGTTTLTAGWHSIVVTFFEKGGGEALTVSWQGPGFAKQLLPSSRLYRQVPDLGTNAPPVLAPPGDQLASVGQAIALALVATDPDADPLVFGAAGLPPGLALDPSTGAIAGAVPAGGEGAYSVTVGVSDGPSADSSSFTWTVTSVPNTPPAVVDPGPQASRERDVVSLAVSASDADGDPLGWGASGLPPGLAIDPLSGVISGVVADGATGPYTVDVTVDDGISPVTVQFPWSVAPPPPVPAEVGVVTASEAWVQVDLDRRYDAPVVVATPVHAPGDPPIAVRVRNAAGTAFEMQLARLDGSGAAVGADVHYLVVEAGVYTRAVHGVTLEAARIPSSVTDGAGSWVGEPRAFAQAYAAPVVVGQVISANDPAPSVFWAAGASPEAIPGVGGLVVGKHVGEDPSAARVDETLGYVVIESGGGRLADRGVFAGVADGSVAGVGDAPPYPALLTFVGSLDAAVATLAGVAGGTAGEGGWAVLHGAPSAAGTSLPLAVDEDTLGDAERQHPAQSVAFLAFGAPPECADGLENDGDGLVDAADPGCGGLSELEAPACSDGVDNDGDGLVDFDGGGVGAPDPGCLDASGARERTARCGLGFESALALLAWAARARRRRAARPA